MIDVRRQYLVRWLSFACLAHAAVAVAQTTATPAFRVHSIAADSTYPACAAIDVNEDGKLDIVSGGWWYEAPAWTRRFLRDVPEIRGRFDDYSNLPLDCNGDGRLDLISVNYRSESMFWIENPGPPADKDSSPPWTTHLIAKPGASETGRLVDVDGDGRLDILPNGAKFAAWWRWEVDPPAAPSWRRYDLPQQLAGHGLGAGDLNGDGRLDLVGARGWAEGPDDPLEDRWVFHEEFQLHRDASIPILVHDVDDDGDADLIWGRGHRTGLYWLEQSPSAAGRREWTMHCIDSSWSQAHALLLADLNGDGRRELIAGKRWLGHDGKDLGEWDPLVIHAYDFDKTLRTWRAAELTREAPAGMDLDPKAVDLDGDGDQDLLAASRAGLWWLENVGPDPASGKPQVAKSLDDRLPEDAALNPRRLLFRPAPGGPLPVNSPQDWAQRRAAILRSMQVIMGPLPQSHRRTPLDVVVLDSQPGDGYTRQTISYQAEPGSRVSAYLLIPANLTQRAPAALCLHPTASIGKGVVMGYGKENRQYAHELAQRGYVCLAPDYPSFGDLSDYNFGADDYVSGTMKAIWNNLRGLDLLEARPEVDPDRIVCIGHSLGGHNALFTAAMDQRVAAVVTSCGFTAFHHYYGGDLQGWTSDRYMPRIRDWCGNDPDRTPFDFFEVLGAVAPRPVFVNAPLHDSNFEVQGVRQVEAELGPLYQLLGAPPERLVFRYPDAAHDFPTATRQQVYAWLDKQWKR